MNNSAILQIPCSCCIQNLAINTLIGRDNKRVNLCYNCSYAIVNNVYFMDGLFYIIHLR